MRTLRRWRYTIALGLLLLLVAALWGDLAVQRSRCEDHDGHYVRGLLWFECVKGT